MISSRIVETLQSAPAIFSKHVELAVVYLFGSHARGTAGTESDLDLGLVYRARDLPRAAHERVATELARDVAQLTGVESVDVIELETQGPIFCHAVLREGLRLFVADEARRTDFESETIVRSLDFRPTYELATRGKVGALRRWLREHHDVGATPIQARRAPGQSG